MALNCISWIRPHQRQGKPVCIEYFSLESQLQQEIKAETNCFLRRFCKSLHMQELKTPLNSNWEQILKCQGQLGSDSFKVPGLKILVSLKEQGERSCTPAVQIEIVDSTRFPFETDYFSSLPL